MTLLHVITRLSLGGSARNTIDSVAAAARAGYRTILATGPSTDEPDITFAAQRGGWRIVRISSFRRQVSPVHDLRALAQTIRWIRRERAHILHTHTSKAGIIGRLAGYLSRVPVILHTPHGHVLHGYYGATLTRFFTMLERMAARRTDRIVVLTERGVEQHLAQGIGRAHQYVVIPSGVDIEGLRAQAPSRAEARARLDWDESHPFILGIGRLVPVKGFDLVVRAMPEVLRKQPAARLVLVGDGPERTRLQQLARESQVLHRITFAGATEGLAPYLAAADILVAPSRNEGMGRAIVEAMSLGLPVVASRVGGIPSVVSDGESGRLVSPEDPAGIADALIGLLGDPGLRDTYGACGKKRAELFSLPRMESLLLKLYRTVSIEKGLVQPAPEDEAPNEPPDGFY